VAGDPLGGLRAVGVRLLLGRRALGLREQLAGLVQRTFLIHNNFLQTGMTPKGAGPRGPLGYTWADVGVVTVHKTVANTW
jgi:hypothetical protein